MAESFSGRTSQPLVLWLFEGIGFGFGMGLPFLGRRVSKVGRLISERLMPINRGVVNEYQRIDNVANLPTPGEVGFSQVGDVQREEATSLQARLEHRLTNLLGRTGAGRASPINWQKKFRVYFRGKTEINDKDSKKNAKGKKRRNLGEAKPGTEGAVSARTDITSLPDQRPLVPNSSCKGQRTSAACFPRHQPFGPSLPENLGLQQRFFQDLEGAT